VLSDIYCELVKKYTNDLQLIKNLWSEIQSKYTEKSRHYHTLGHLEHLIDQLNEIKNGIVDWDIVSFAVFYHDIIYNVTKSDNEEKSAELARQRLKKINYPNHEISKCTEMIMATKRHSPTGISDIDHFTDADLSILGQHWDVYSNYSRQIRKEYSIYPDLVYTPGRKKVLSRFLNMDRIFKTDHFFMKFEEQARRNLVAELAIL
jgi:predicted metal-dependent HD superfamily phosphohydrolase